jgi:hypothetical protein
MTTQYIIEFQGEPPQNTTYLYSAYEYIVSGDTFEQAMDQARLLHRMAGDMPYHSTFASEY